MHYPIQKLNQIDSGKGCPMCDYHSISVNRRGTILHEPGNIHAMAIYQKRWAENTLTRTYHWNFEYDPTDGPYPGALECMTGDGYAQEPSQRILDIADEHYRRLEALHNGDIAMLEYFSGREYRDVRYRMALGSNTTPDILTKLAESNNASIREEIAMNPNTPSHVLAEMSLDKDEDVRCAIAIHPNTQTNILEQLAKDKNEDVRYQISYNPNTPVEVLKVLTKDTDESVRRVAQWNFDHRNKSN